MPAASQPNARSTPIQVEEVSVSFRPDTPILQDVNLTVEGGNFVSLLGPSGCGKTTLLRLIAGLVPPTSGQVQEASNLQKAFVFQDANLLPWRTVNANIALSLELLGVPHAEQAPRIEESLRLIGLTEQDRLKYPRMLSGGMRMRVSLARALVTHPDLLLLDEPFAALDDMLRQQLNEDLLRIWTQQQWTALFVTHNVAEAAFLSQRVVIMSSHPGMIQETIPVPFDYPRSSALRSSPEFAAFTGRLTEALRATLNPLHSTPPV